MAKFTSGPVVAEIRGSIGGSTFSRNRYGAIIRNRTKPTVPTSEPFLLATARMTAASQAWQDLTADQRAAWNTYAQTHPITGSLGEAQILTGHTTFAGIACRRALVGAGALEAPPVVPAPAPLISLSLTADIGVGNFELAFTATPLEDAHALYFQACIVSSAGITYVKNLLRLLPISAPALASPYDIESAMTARFGDLVVDQKVVVLGYVYFGGSGLVSAPLRCEATIVST